MAKGISKVIFGDFPDNASLGIVGFSITTSGAELPASELADVIYAIRKNTYPSTKNITIQGKFNSGNLPGLYTMCQTLKDHGYTLRAISDGREYFPWFDKVDYLATFVENKIEWVKFASHQIIYPLAPEELKEPTLPPVNNLTMLYLDTREVDREQVVAFLSGAKHQWNIFHTTKPLIQEEVKI